MAGWPDERPLLTYEIEWTSGRIETIEAKGIVHADSGNIVFWRDNTMILSASSARVVSVRLVTATPEGADR